MPLPLEKQIQNDYGRSMGLLDLEAGMTSAIDAFRVIAGRALSSGMEDGGSVRADPLRVTTHAGRGAGHFV